MRKLGLCWWCPVLRPCSSTSVFSVPSLPSALWGLDPPSQDPLCPQKRLPEHLLLLGLEETCPLVQTMPSLTSGPTTHSQDEPGSLLEKALVLNSSQVFCKQTSDRRLPDNVPTVRSRGALTSGSRRLPISMHSTQLLSTARLGLWQGPQHTVAHCMPWSSHSAGFYLKSSFWV